MAKYIFWFRIKVELDGSVSVLGWDDITFYLVEEGWTNPFSVLSHQNWDEPPTDGTHLSFFFIFSFTSPYLFHLGPLSL